MDRRVRAPPAPQTPCSPPWADLLLGEKDPGLAQHVGEVSGIGWDTSRKGCACPRAHETTHQGREEISAFIHFSIFIYALLIWVYIVITVSV